NWGIPMPNDPTHSVYVWIDALSNYYTALGMPEVGLPDDGKFHKYWPASLHLIGKDILWFHSVYWPCLLLSLDLPLPKRIFAHGWWMSEGKKMSKSLGNFISREVIAELCQAYSVDVFRYFLLRAVPFGTDGDFSKEMFQQRYNTELANGIGNLLSRTVNMIGRYFDGKIPAAQLPGEQEREIISAAVDLHDNALPLMEGCEFFSYIEKILALAGATNRYIDVTAPFKLAKDPSQAERLGTILYTCAEAVRIILLYLQPLMPETSIRGLSQLNWQAPADRTLDEIGRWGILQAGTMVAKGDGLFPRKE
ncbi:MAG: methionine--tRNA ligase, partial [Planctomycetaceae bacterium]